MATCMYCGGQIPDGAKYCTNCGAALPVEAPVQQQYQPPSHQQVSLQPTNQTQGSYSAPVQSIDDSGSIGWGILGFIFPIVGIVLFFVWRNTKPNCAKVSLYGAIISIALVLIVRFTGLFTFFW